VAGRRAAGGSGAERVLREEVGLPELTVEDCVSPLRMPKLDALPDDPGGLGRAFVAVFAARSSPVSTSSGAACSRGFRAPVRALHLGYTSRAMLTELLLVLLGYLSGSIPTGVLVGRAYGVDVQKVGSGNTGMANVMRAAGKGPAMLTMGGDMLKGLVPVVVARLLTDSEWAVAAVALAAVVGACYSVFLRFKGGKAVATGAGTSIGLAPVLGLILFGVWWAVALSTRYTSLAAIVIMVVSPFAFWLTGQPAAFVAYTILGGALVIWRHRENAKRLIAGTENRFGERARPKADGRVR